MTATLEPLDCWVVTDGRAGIENQALGLAEAVARLRPLRITPKRIAVKPPWRSLPRAFWGDPFPHLSTSGALLRPPFPKLWIACGRQSIPFTIAVGERNPAVLTVQIQDPRAPARKFGLVVPPEHDRLAGPNVLPIIGSPNRITAAAIARDAEQLAPLFAGMPRPRVLMLIGGPNRAFGMEQAAFMRIARIARSLARAEIAVLVSGSRRTPPEAIRTLKRALERFPHFIWEGAPVAGLQNPYFALLGSADHVMVTEDSVNMAAEAAATGKPVHVISLPRRWGGLAAAKFDRFHAALARRGASRKFTGRFEQWTYETLDETARAAAEIARRIEALSSRGERLATG
jgi:hypothetical protein